MVHKNTQDDNLRQQYSSHFVNIILTSVVQLIVAITHKIDFG